MSRPVTLPTWATDANYAAGSDPWSGTPTRSAPSGGKQGTGYVPAAADAAEEDNWLIGELCDLTGYLDKAATGFGFVFRDEFMTYPASSNTENPWSETITGAGSSVAYTDDSAIGGYGAIAHTLGSSGGDATIKTIQLPIGTNDLRCSFRVRKVSGSGSFRLGIFGTNGIFFQGSLASGNWFAVYGSGSTQDLGVAPSTTYQNLELVRRSGVIYFSIDGTQLFSVADSDSLAPYTFGCVFLNGSAAAGVAHTDLASLWVNR